MVFHRVRTRFVRILFIHNFNNQTMRAEYIQQEFQKADVLETIDPKSIAKDAKLTLIYRLMFVIVWPKVKPFISAKLGVKFAELIEQILGGI